MVRKLTMLLLLFLLTSWGHAQSIDEQIHPEDNSELISKGRTLILDLVLSGSIDQALDVRDYLMDSLQKDDYLALYPKEDWILLYMSGNDDPLNSILTQARNYVSLLSDHFILPQEDFLLENLTTTIARRKEEVLKKIRSFDITQEDEAFLILNLEYFTSIGGADWETQNMLNENAEDYFTNFPGSQFEPYIRENIRNVVLPSPWGFGVELFTGLGVLTDSLSNNFSNGGPVGFAFDLNYRRFAFYFRDYIGFSRTKLDMASNTVVWEKNSQVRIFLPEFSTGFAVIDNQMLKIAPFVGIASMSISPTKRDLQNESQLKQVELEFTTTYTAGLNLDIKLGQPKISFVSSEQEDSYWFLRVRYGYNSPHYEKKYAGMAGNFHYITIGLGGLGRKIGKVY